MAYWFVKTVCSNGNYYILYGVTRGFVIAGKIFAQNRFNKEQKKCPSDKGLA